MVLRNQVLHRSISLWYPGVSLTLYPTVFLLPKPETHSPVNSPMAVTKAAKPITTKARVKTAARNKKNARMISRMERNKSKPPAKTEPIMVSEDSDSSIERFLAEEGFCGDEPPYDFVDNLPPFLRDNHDFPGINPSRETLREIIKPPFCSKGCFTLRPVWTFRDTICVPKLQSKIYDLEKQVAMLTGQDAKG
jgi:hypothetical protein